MTTLRPAVLDDDPKALLLRWCQQRSLAPPIFVASQATGGVQVLGSFKLGSERYVRAHHTAADEHEAELEVVRDLFVQLQAIVGPIVLRPPSQRARDRQAARESAAVEAAREAAMTPPERRQVLEAEARQQGGFVFLSRRRAKGRWTAEGLFQVGTTQIPAGPFEARTREEAEAWVVTYLLRACRQPR